MKIFFGFLGVAEKSKTKEQSIDHRVELADRAFQVWQDHPLGVGLDNFRTFVGTYAHSNFLELLVATGVIGLIIFYGGYFSFFSQMKKKNLMDKPWFRCVTGTLVSIMVMDLFNVSYYSKTFWIFIGVISGFVLLKIPENRDEPKSA